MKGKIRREKREMGLVLGRLRSLFILLGFCFNGLASALMENLWQMISRSISGMPVGVHANTSKLSDKNLLNKAF